MKSYQNLSGDSGVSAYEIGDDSISVRFRDGITYVYTKQSTAAQNIDQMKTLAVQGKGLNSFISRVVRKGYASKY